MNIENVLIFTYIKKIKKSVDYLVDGALIVQRLKAHDVVDVP